MPRRERKPISVRAGAKWSFIHELAERKRRGSRTITTTRLRYVVLMLYRYYYYYYYCYYYFYYYYYVGALLRYYYYFYFGSIANDAPLQPSPSSPPPPSPPPLPSSPSLLLGTPTLVTGSTTNRHRAAFLAFLREANSDIPGCNGFLADALPSPNALTLRAPTRFNNRRYVSRPFHRFLASRNLIERMSRMPSLVAFPRTFKIGRSLFDSSRMQKIKIKCVRIFLFIYLIVFEVRIFLPIFGKKSKLLMWKYKWYE